jgi:hypothetical protein
MRLQGAQRVNTMVSGLVTACALIMSGCGYFIDTRGNGSDALAAFSAPTYSEVYATVLGPRCLKCHDQSDDLDVQSIDSIRASLPGMLAQVRSRQMPPPRKSPQLTESQISLLIRWLEAGAPVAGPEAPQPQPESEPEREPEPEQGPPLLPTYASLRENILVPKCLRCHSPGGRSEDAPLGSLEELLSLGIVNKEHPERSTLVRALRGEGTDLMPPPRSRLEPLSEGEIAVIIEWIRLGTPE